MAQSTRALISYLSARNYNCAISLKTLSCPSAKDFVNIAKFLCHQIDPNFEFTDKFENDLLALLKGMGYPFGISKSYLSPVISPHSWPMLLACLTWMVELLSYDEAVVAAEEGEDDMEADPDKQFLKYLSDAYMAFLSANDDRFNMLNEALARDIEMKNREYAEQLQEKQAEMEECRREMEALGSKKSSVPELQARRANYNSDLAKFKTLIRQLQDQQGKLQQRVEEKQQEVKRRERELATLSARKQELQEQLDAQELSAADVQRMAQERKHLQDTLQNAAAQKDKAQSAVWSLEMRLGSVLTQLEEAVREYNNKALSLQLIPATAKYARSQDFELAVLASTPAAFDANGGGLLSQDVRTGIKPALQELKNLAITKTHKARAAALEVEERLTKSNEAKQARESAINALQQELKRLEEQARRRKEALDRQLQEYAHETEAVEMQIQRLRDAAGASQTLARHREEIMRLSATLEERKVKHAARMQRMRADVVAVLDMVADYKTAVSTALDALERAVEESEVAVGLAEAAPEAAVPAEQGDESAAAAAAEARPEDVLVDA